MLTGQFWGRLFYVMFVLMFLLFPTLTKGTFLSFTPKWWLLELKGACLCPTSCRHFIVNWRCLSFSCQEEGRHHAVSVCYFQSPATVRVSRTDQGFSSKDIPWSMCFKSCILKNFEKWQRPGDHKFKETGVRWESWVLLMWTNMALWCVDSQFQGHQGTHPTSCVIRVYWDISKIVLISGLAAVTHTFSSLQKKSKTPEVLHNVASGLITLL